MWKVIISHREVQHDKMQEYIVNDQELDLLEVPDGSCVYI